MSKKLFSSPSDCVDVCAPKKGIKPKPDTVDRQSEASGFPIVAIGASAGGLEACSKFFGALSADTGMAFVLVQHLDPSHKSMLNELLSRITSLTTHEVEDGMLIEPDHIYIIPPNAELGILHQVLHLFPLSDIKVNIDIPDLEERMFRVMDTVVVDIVEVRDTAGNWYNLRIRPYKTIDNRIAGVVLIFVGMSSALERRLAAVVRDSSDAIILQDFDGTILAWNRQAEKVHGYTEMEALTMSMRSLIPESARPQAEAMVAALRRGEEMMPLEAVRLHKEGQTISLWLVCTVLVDEHGRPYAISCTERLIGAKK